MPSGHREGGAGCEMPFSGFQDFDPVFGPAIQRMIAARPGISITSGYRTPERQAMLFARAVKKYGSPEKARHWVAPPGHSMHNRRMAADLGFASPEDEAWAHQHAADYGLRFRMGHEPWHIEPINASMKREPSATSANIGTAKESSVSQALASKTLLTPSPLSEAKPT